MQRTYQFLQMQQSRRNSQPQPCSMSSQVNRINKALEH